MRKFLLSVITISFLLAGSSASAQNVFKKEDSKPGLRFSKKDDKKGKREGLFGQKKKKKRKFNKKMLGAGVVIGDPAGIGLRVEFQPKRFGIALDAAINRIRLDSGPYVSAGVMKIDGRYYMKGFLGNVFRLYAFGGLTLTGVQMGDSPSTVIQADIGLGGGIRISKFSVTGEAGLLIPAKSATDLKARFGTFGNVAVLFWIF